MANHTWTNRTLPPLVAVAVIGCVWYALESRPNNTVSVPTAKASGTATTTHATANAGILPSVCPTVKKLGMQLQFSVNPTTFKHVQKVEFYVENQFVGTAYNQPYSVAVAENNLTAGTHTVVAKIYTMESTSQSQPATFTANPTAPPASAIDTSDAQGVAIAATSAAPANTAPASPTVEAPSDVTGTPGNDGTTATLTWTGSANAIHYQVWRDGNVVATPTGMGYTDTGLNPGQTYDYQIVAMDSSGGASDPSGMVAVTTLSLAPDASPVNNSPALAPNPNSPPNTSGS